MELIYTKPGSIGTLESQLQAYSDLSVEEAQRLASETFNGEPRIAVPITPRADWPPLDPDQLRLVEYRIKRIQRAINEGYPLLEGETLDSYFASFLSSDFLDYPVGTVAVLRTTSFGELVFIDPKFIVHGAEINDADSAEGVALVRQPIDAAAIAWGALAIDIGKSLLGAIAGEIGSAIFQKLFPPSVPSYFDQVYASFEGIVQGVINENKRKELSGRVRSVQDGMITYNTLKKDPIKYDEAQKLLSTVWNDSRYITNELKEFPEIGLGLFVIAGGLHLAIVQEKAVSDRDYSNPNESPWADDLIRKANEFAPYATENRNRIVTTRANAISEVRFVPHSTYVPPAGPIDDSYWIWNDTFVGDKHKYPKRQGCCDPDPQSTARNDRRTRWDNTVGVLTNELASVIPVASDWKKVGSNPIPV